MKRALLVAVAFVPLAALVGLAAPPAAGHGGWLFQDSSKVERGQIANVVTDFDGRFEPEQMLVVRPRFEVYEGDLVIANVKENGSRAVVKEALVQFQSPRLMELQEWLKNEREALLAARDRVEADERVAREEEQLALDRAKQEKRDADIRVDMFEKSEIPLTEKVLDLEIQRAKDQVEEKTEEKKQLDDMYKSEQLTNQSAQVVQKRTDRALQRAIKELEIANDRSRLTRARDLPIQKEQILLAQKEAQQKINSLQRLSDVLTRIRATDKQRAVLKHKQLADQFERLTEDVKQLTLNAGNFEGIVYYGTLENGDWVGTPELVGLLKKDAKVKPAQVALAVCSYALKVRLDVTERDLQHFASGQTATVMVNGFPDEPLKGTTGERAPVAWRDDAAGKHYRGEVKLDVTFNKQEKFVPGMRCRVRVQAPVMTPRIALLVPVTSVREEGARSFCYVKSADGWSPREVKLGRSDGRRVEVLEGVKDGDEVMTYPVVK